VKRNELKPEEKLQKIINQISEERSNYISVNKLMDILGIEPNFRKNLTKPFMPNSTFEEYTKRPDYRESYIS
jgi:hypothetical protein